MKFLFPPLRSFRTSIRTLKNPYNIHFPKYPAHAEGTARAVCPYFTTPFSIKQMKSKQYIFFPTFGTSLRHYASAGIHNLFFDLIQFCKIYTCNIKKTF